MPLTTHPLSVANFGTLFRRLAVVCLIGPLGATIASGFDLTYEAFDQPDVNPGEDLWEGRFTIGGATFDPGLGFTIYFDSAHYGAISGPVPPVPVGWDFLVIQADLTLSLPALFDGLSLVNDAPTTDPFLVEFVWLGSGKPGSVDFEYYTLEGGLEILASGSSRTPFAAPDSGPGWLAGPALVATLALAHRRRC